MTLQEKIDYILESRYSYLVDTLKNLRKIYKDNEIAPAIEDAFDTVYRLNLYRNLEITVAA